MLFVPRQKLDDVHDLRAALQNAIGIELGTIPPYLTALFSIKPGANAAPGAIVRSVVIEEMLHLGLVCNLLNAVGGRPDIPAAVLDYPSELPMHIGYEPGKPFKVPLARLSQASVANFMTIEEPEHGPLVFRGLLATEIEPEYHTIGGFYEAVCALMVELGEDVFTHDPTRQVTGWIGPDYLHAVDTIDDARRAIDLIVEQGEGSSQSPGAGPDSPDELAHFYRFQQIQRQETLKRDPDVPEGYEWGDPTIALDDAGVWPMIDNPPLVPLPEGSPVSLASDQFDATYTTLIDELQRTFDGTPQALGPALAQMHALRLEAAQLVTMGVPGTQGTAGPRFRYLGRPDG